MFNFSKTGLKENLIKAINDAPKSSNSVDEAFADQIKALAIYRINAVEQNGAYVSIHAHCVPAINAQQIEIQITGKQL